MGNWGLLSQENVNHRHGAQAEHSFLKNHRLLKYSELVCNSENCWPRASKAERRNGLEKWNKTQGAFVMPEGFAEWGCMDNGKASRSRPPLLTAQYYKHHFTTAMNISLANYFPRHQRGCTEVAALNSHHSALIFQGVMEGRAGAGGAALKHTALCRNPICSIPSFLGDGITPSIHKHTQTLPPSINPFITHPLWRC